MYSNDISVYCRNRLEYVSVVMPARSERLFSLPILLHRCIISVSGFICHCGRATLDVKTCTHLFVHEFETASEHGCHLVCTPHNAVDELVECQFVVHNNSQIFLHHCFLQLYRCSIFCGHRAVVFRVYGSNPRAFALL